MGHVLQTTTVLVLFSVSALAATPEDYRFQRGQPPAARPVAATTTSAPVTTRAATPESGFNTFRKLFSANPEGRKMANPPLNCGGFYRGSFAISECNTLKKKDGQDSLFCKGKYTNPTSGGIIGGIQSVNPFSNEGKDIQFPFEVTDVQAKAYLCMKNKAIGENKRSGVNVRDFNIATGMHLCDPTSKLYNDPRNRDPRVKDGHFQRVAGMMSADALKVQAADYLAAKGSGKSAEELLEACTAKRRTAPPIQNDVQLPKEPRAPLPVPPGGPGDMHKPPVAKTAPPVKVTAPPAPQRELPAPLPLPLPLPAEGKQ